MAPASPTGPTRLSLVPVAFPASAVAGRGAFVVRLLPVFPDPSDPSDRSDPTDPWLACRPPTCLSSAPLSIPLLRVLEVDKDIGFVLKLKKTRDIGVLTSEGGLDSSSGCEDKWKFLS